MQNKFTWKAILASAVLVFSAGMAQATPANMLTLGKTNPPIGHYEFCGAHPDQCVATEDDGPVELTEARWKTLVKVNYKINSAIEPLTDQEIYGVEERWAYPKNVGDCEDYVLLKRKKLIEHGFSPSDLLITVVLQPNGDGHAILTVRTDHGDFVLDNMRNKVLLWSETEYTFLKRQSSSNAGAWVKLEDDHSPALGSLQ